MANSNADAPRQGERPRVCCHQCRDTTAQLEEQTLAEKQYRKRNLKSRREEFYEKVQVHIHPADAVDAADGKITKEEPSRFWRDGSWKY